MKDTIPTYKEFPQENWDGKRLEFEADLERGAGKKNCEALFGDDGRVITLTVRDQVGAVLKMYENGEWNKQYFTHPDDHNDWGGVAGTPYLRHTLDNFPRKIWANHIALLPT
ncbi:hypothetical protein FJZ28_01335, partial [Candidatus Peregrinibacteria bacterium]|nr:hypothetical protein [Candidatus Peregrinibacteria bacterium]